MKRNIIDIDLFSLKYIERGRNMANLKAKEYRQFEDIKYVKKDGSGCYK